MKNFMRVLCVMPIRLYQYCISPALPPSCRFYPTCSTYAAEAIMRHGILRGGFLALRRLIRCHPFGKYGYDPVPPAGDELSLSGPKSSGSEYRHAGQ